MKVLYILSNLRFCQRLIYLRDSSHVTIIVVTNAAIIIMIVPDSDISPPVCILANLSGANR